MELDLNDEQKKLLLETLAKAHMVEYMQGKDNSDLDQLIKIVIDDLVKEGKEEIFHMVFMPDIFKIRINK